MESDYFWTIENVHAIIYYQRSLDLIQNWWLGDEITTAPIWKENSRSAKRLVLKFKSMTNSKIDAYSSNDYGRMICVVGEIRMLENIWFGSGSWGHH